MRLILQHFREKSMMPFEGYAIRYPNPDPDQMLGGAVTPSRNLELLHFAFGLFQPACLAERLKKVDSQSPRVSTTSRRLRLVRVLTKMYIRGN